MRVRLWTQQRHESPCALIKFQGLGCPMMGGESDGGGNNGEFKHLLIEGDDKRVGDFGMYSMDKDDVSFVDGVLEGALGALGDET
uniref:Uncharacterized protein n=1 Tax=Tanacetum cinerariifolium TaxID=118510 RepID=A0A699HMW8_TANCI|nr:hypothetical protein [Tanacetum cinerariifolium]